MNTATLIGRNPEVLWRELAGETVVYHPGNGQAVALDPIGTLVWQSLEQPATIGELVPDFAEAFSVAPAEIEADLVTLFGKLLGTDLVIELEGGE